MKTYKLSVFAVFAGTLLLGHCSTVLSEEGQDAEETLVTRAKRLFGDIDEQVGNVGIDGLGKLKDVLPYAIVSYCFSEYPKQTLGVLGCLLAWCLFTTERGRRWVQTFQYVAAKAVGLGDEGSAVGMEELVIDSDAKDVQPEDDQHQNADDSSVATT